MVVVPTGNRGDAKADVVVGSAAESGVTGRVAARVRAVIARRSAGRVPVEAVVVVVPGGAAGRPVVVVAARHADKKKPRDARVAF